MGSEGDSMVVEREREWLGPYELIRKVGSGGFSETYLARAYGPEGFVKDVCIKRVRSENVGDPDYVGPLRDEAVMQAALSHPNIAAVHDFSKIEGTHLIVMEFVDGASLTKVIRALDREQRKVPATLALHVMGKVLEALDHAHRLVLHGEEQALIHRDINPNNILISRTGHPKLIDFGLVKAKDRSYRTEEGKIRGTLSYMAPEQILAQAAGISEDARVDVYAVGIILHELLAGAHPLRKPGVSDYQLMDLVVKGKKPSLHESAPDVPAALSDLVDRMTAKDPKQRPSTALEALELLAAFMPGAELATRRELAELIKTVAGPMASLSIGQERPRDIDTATRVRDRAPSSGVQSRSQQSEKANPPTTDVMPAPATEKGVDTDPPEQTPRKGASRWVAIVVAVVAVAIAALVGTQKTADLGTQKTADLGTQKTADRVSTTAPAALGPVATAPKPAATKASPEAATTSAPAASTTAAAATQLADSVNAPQVAAEEVDDKTPSAPAATHHDAPPAKANTTSAAASRDMSTAERNSWLNVSVQPNDRTWQVWVDGQYYGTADVKIKVSPGRHLVAIGAEKPTLKRAVRVSPHGTRDVPFAL